MTDQHAALDYAMSALERGDAREAAKEALHDADQAHGLTYGLAFDTMRDFVWALIADKFAALATQPATSQEPDGWLAVKLNGEGGIVMPYGPLHPHPDRPNDPRYQWVPFYIGEPK